MPTTPGGLHVVISREERMRAINALREKMEEDHSDPQANRLERELRLLDDRMRVVRISPRAGELHPKERGPGVIPGRWHIKLLTHPQNAYFPICGPNWAYRDPELAIVEEMKARDLWRRGALEEMRKAEDDEDRRVERASQLDREQGEDEVALAYRAAKRVAGDGGEHRRRMGAGGVKTSDSGLVLPAGVKA
jgi:hypothetical protein